MVRAGDKRLGTCWLIGVPVEDDKGFDSGPLPKILDPECREAVSTQNHKKCRKYPQAQAPRTLRQVILCPVTVWPLRA